MSGIEMSATHRDSVTCTKGTGRARFGCASTAGVCLWRGREMAFACAVCGFMTTNYEKLDDHLIAEHTDRSIEALVEQALREALQVWELERMWRL